MKLINLNHHKGKTEVKTKAPSDVTSPVPSKHRWNLNGATRMGKVRTENQDAFYFHQFSPSQAFAMVCDGAGGIAGGREAAQTVVEVITSEFALMYNAGLVPNKALEIAIRKARMLVKKRQLTGITTAILVWFDGDMLYYATLGDGALTAVWPDGMVTQVLTPHHLLDQPSNIISGYVGKDCNVAARTGTLRLEPGTTVMLMSDGASDLFPYQDFAENRDVYSVPLSSKNECGLANHFLSQLEAARNPETGAYLHHDNMTLVLAHLSERTEHEDKEKIAEKQEAGHA